MRNFSVILVLVSSLFFGCQAKVESDVNPNDNSQLELTYSNSQAEGMIDGQPWAVKVVEAHKSKEENDERYIFKFYSSDPVYPGTSMPKFCDEFAWPSDYKIISYKAPISVGEHKMGQSPSGVVNMMTFAYKPNGSDGFQNVATDQGKMRIDSVEGGVVKGAIVARYDDAHYVSGIFTAKICD